MMLRPGNAGSNTAVDHCDVIMRSIDQLPAAYQAGHQPGDDAALVAHPVRVRADSAGATKPFLADLRDRNIGFSVGFPIDAAVRDLITGLPPQGWRPAVNADGAPRGGAEVVELAGYTSLSGWPARSRLMWRREEPHPDAQLSAFDDLHGLRHTAFLTDDNRNDIAQLEVEHRCRARVEDRIRCWKACGATHQPYWDAPANQAWLNVTLIALVLVAWTQHLGFAGIDLATAEPATFRTSVLAIAAQTATRARRLHLPRAPRHIQRHAHNQTTPTIPSHRPNNQSRPE